MSKYRLVSNKNLIKIMRKYMGKVPVNEREMSMFEGNLLPGFFRPQMEGKHKIIYTAPMSVQLLEYKKQNLTVHKLYNVIAQLVEITKRIEMYGFYLGNLVLDERMIYVKEVTGELVFLYEPVSIRENSTNVYAFLADLISGIKSDSQNMQEECRRWKSFLADTGNYRIEDIENFIRNIYPQIYQQITRVEREKSGKSGYIASSRLSYQEHDKGHENVGNKGYEREEDGTTLLQEDHEGGTTLLGEDEGGTVLLTEDVPAARLCRRKGLETVEIIGYEFAIGKDSGIEYCIKGNRAISRKHAVIFHRGNEYTIRDEKSTNHTYVNGKMLEPEAEERLQSGDVIRLADEEFDFLME